MGTHYRHRVKPVSFLVLCEVLFLCSDNWRVICRHSQAARTEFSEATYPSSELDKDSSSGVPPKPRRPKPVDDQTAKKSAPKEAESPTSGKPSPAGRKPPPRRQAAKKPTSGDAPDSPPPGKSSSASSYGDYDGEPVIHHYLYNRVGGKIPEFQWGQDIPPPKVHKGPSGRKKIAPLKFKNEGESCGEGGKGGGENGGGGNGGGENGGSGNNNDNDITTTVEDITATNTTTTGEGGNGGGESGGGGNGGNGSGGEGGNGGGENGGGDNGGGENGESDNNNDNDITTTVEDITATTTTTANPTTTTTPKPEEPGCDGVPGSGKKKDSCGVCGGPGRTTEDCFFGPCTLYQEEASMPYYDKDGGCLGVDPTDNFDKWFGHLPDAKKACLKDSHCTGVFDKSKSASQTNLPDDWHDWRYCVKKPRSGSSSSMWCPRIKQDKSPYTDPKPGPPWGPPANVPGRPPANAPVHPSPPAPLPAPTEPLVKNGQTSCCCMPPWCEVNPTEASITGEEVTFNFAVKVKKDDNMKLPLLVRATLNNADGGLVGSRQQTVVGPGGTVDLPVEAEVKTSALGLDIPDVKQGVPRS